MSDNDLGQYLRRRGQSETATKRCLALVREFEKFLRDQRNRTIMADAREEDLRQFVLWVESKPKRSAKSHLWALRYYYEYAGSDTMRRLASSLRAQRITRKAISLKDLVGVQRQHVDKLAALGIRTADDMLRAGQSPSRRQELSEQTGIPVNAILELVKLADLSRIFGVKGIRARLYHDAGVDSVEKMAQWDPKALRTMLVEFVDRTGFSGIAPLPKEAEFTVAEARRLPKVVEY